ncbi:hypothetical protein Tco_1315222 [Tanacetum coccineum]
MGGVRWPTAVGGKSTVVEAQSCEEGCGWCGGVERRFLAAEGETSQGGGSKVVWQQCEERWCDCVEEPAVDGVDGGSWASKMAVIWPRKRTRGAE